MEMEEKTNSELSAIVRKQKFTGKVVKTSIAGALVDIGLETPGVIHISQLSKEPVNKVEDVVQVGQEVDVWVKRVVPNKNRIELTMIEPLALEWREIKKDMVVKGAVVRIENFGIFVEIGAERPGLVHISEITHDYINTPKDVVKVGDEVEAKVLSVNRQRKQIKLSMKAMEIPPAEFITNEKSGGRNKQGDVELTSDEPVPTAMEMALREAMERTQSDETTPESAQQPRKKSGSEDTELEDILSRTLNNRVKSTTK